MISVYDFRVRNVSHVLLGRFGLLNWNFLRFAFNIVLLEQFKWQRIVQPLNAAVVLRLVLVSLGANISSIARIH